MLMFHGQKPTICGQNGVEAVFTVCYGHSIQSKHCGKASIVAKQALQLLIHRFEWRIFYETLLFSFDFWHRLAGCSGCQCCERQYFFCRPVCGAGHRIPMVCLFKPEKGEGQ